MPQSREDAQERAARNEVYSRFHVSRETMERLSLYVDLVEKWSKAINLVSSADRRRLWSRHVRDSLGLTDSLPERGLWLDIGSGGGFPAIPLALFARDRGLGVSLWMVEADQRKAVFLRRAVADLGLSARVFAQRVEDLVLEDEPPRLITARALAPVDKLLDLVEPVSNSSTELALLKGANVAAELTDAQKRWHMSFETVAHPLSLDGFILRIQGFSRADTS